MVASNIYALYFLMNQIWICYCCSQIPELKTHFQKITFFTFELKFCPALWQQDINIHSNSSLRLFLDQNGNFLPPSGYKYILKMEVAVSSKTMVMVQKTK
jgi:hypothetical protein